MRRDKLYREIIPPERVPSTEKILPTEIKLDKAFFSSHRQKR